MEINFEKLAMRIKEARHRKGITQEKLAAMTGLSPNFIGRIESNNSRVSLASLVKICICLDTNMDYLLSDTIELPDDAILNMTALNDTEKRFIVNTIKGIKEIQAELIYRLK
ncbi:MAG: helix-turn-helix transcriptional regulator [Clostridiales bacterium]|jgi:transcriptional regulator with XRE-family HTH domain|nr:helix-turn-helix transcriptional regulator [Clostridiales bacterium]